MVGTVLGNRYELVEKIGTGGMAEVYKAKCRLLNRYVAVKILKQEFINDEEFLARFKTESQAAASLSHHNIVSIYDVGRDGDYNYIVMEYVEGITLKEYIEKHGIFSWREAVEISIRILEALEHAHQHGIVHRDIKPHNIMISPDKNIKVMDFGIARAATASTLTLSGTTIGSVHYFSPEQAKGSYTDSKSDIYSMGVVMYEMLTGRVPFDGDSPISIAIMQIQSNPPSLKDFNISVPLALESVVMKAMSKDRDMRYQTATSMANDLRRVEHLPEVAVKQAEPEIPEGGTRVMSAVTSSDIENYLNTHREEPIPAPAVREPVKQTEPEKKKDPASLLGYIVAGVFGFCMILLMIVLLGGKGEKQLPGLVGMTLEDARDKYESKKIEIVVEREEASDKYDKGVIISQDPKEGEGYKSKIKISVVVSSGKGDIILKDYSGWTVEEVIEDLENLGLNYTEKDIDDEDAEPGEVVKTKPAEGESVNKGQKITLYVCSSIEVPDVVGKTKKEAEELLEEAGLELGEVSGSDDKEAVVKIQVPSPGENVKKGTKVDVNMENGKKKNLTIYVQPLQSKDTTHIKIVANGETVYNKILAKTDAPQDVSFECELPATVQTYQDGTLNVTRKYDEDGSLLSEEKY